MKLFELKREIQKYQYLEDTKIIDVSIASIISTRLKLGDPLWLILIGASSGGKSQIIRPLSLTDKDFIHRLDDLTENTLLSAAGGDGDKSLLKKIGSHGMLAISDLTVLFSKSSESRAAILSQFRMLYDGEMTKYAGNQSKPISWKGFLGVISGSTPSIYSMFEEVSDMGERFIYYRMKEYDGEKATAIAMDRELFGKDLDDKLSRLYGQYIREVVEEYDGSPIVLSDTVKQHIIEVSSFAERVRTVAHVDRYSSDKKIVRIPTPAMPMRVALQLTTIAKALILMKRHEGRGDILEDGELAVIDWCAYSLANEEKRKCLSVLASVDYGFDLNTGTIADFVGLDTSVVKNFLQNLSAVGILKRTGSGEDRSLTWSLVKQSDHSLIRRIEDRKISENIQNRAITNDETDEMEEILDKTWETL